MPYLPPGLIEDAEFPYSWGKDIRTQISMIEEQYRRMPAEADYYVLLKGTTPANAAMDPVGAPGTTKFDPLYGESVDSNMSTWTQPHLSGNLKASDVEMYASPVRIHRRIQRTAREDELKRYGFDRVRTLIAHIPCSFLDAFGITVTQHDKLCWNNEDFTVMQWSPSGYWKNSNVHLYVTLNLEHFRHGS